MNELHLFAGAGGGILGGILLGHTCVCAVEIEPYRRKVLLQRQRDGILPKFPIWDDVQTFDGNPWRGKVDVLCGGFPCQDISVAGNGAGLDGARSGLWKEMCRIVGEVGPRFVLVENSPALSFRGLGTVLSDLSSLGFDAEWGVIGAKHAGANHQRERIWLVAHSKKTTPRPKNLPEVRVQKQSGGMVWNPLASPDWESMRPEPRRMDDGVSNWVDRLAAIGDGQVPAVVKLAWETLTSNLC